MFKIRYSSVLIFTFTVLILLCLINTLIVEASEDAWTTNAPMTTARSGLGVAVVNGKIYAIGGQADARCLRQNEEYDPTTDTWTQRKSMPTARSDFGIAVYKNKIFVFGGYIGPGDYAAGAELVSGTTEVYDPATNTWETKKSMPTPRKGASANVVNGKIYVIGGAKNIALFHTEMYNLTEVYDPETDSWSEKAPMPTSVWGHASVVVNNTVYMFGGARLTFSGHTPTDTTQIYDTESNTWRYGQPSPKAFPFGAAGSTTGTAAPKRIYVLSSTFGSLEPFLCLNQVYNPENDTWSTGAPMHIKRARFGVAVVNDMLYAIGGAFYSYPAPHASADIYYEKANEQYTPVGYNPVPDDNAEAMPAIYLYALTATAVTIASVGAFAIYYFAKARKTKKKAE